jgi:predicted RNA-binding protein YlqC (UPF0109 family)
MAILPESKGLRKMWPELARHLLRAVSEEPDGVRVDHVWTPKADLLFLRLPSRDRVRLRREDCAALVTVIEGVAAQTDREVVVDLR